MMADNDIYNFFKNFGRGDKSTCKMSHIEVKAQQLRMEAEKKMNNTNFFKSLFTKSSERIEESIEYYSRAGNLFKMAKNWLQAGNAFADAADLSTKNKNQVEAAINFIEAANCFKKCDTERAVEYFLKAITLYQEVGKFIMAAKYHQVIAELLEDEYEVEEAVTYYENAAELYKQECSFSSANKCSEKVAEYAALAGDYDKAITIFEEIACFDLASSLMKYCAKQYFFRAAICLLCTEVDVRPKFHTYVNMYPALEDSREYQLIQYLLGCMEDADEEGFTCAVRKFDSVSQLSQWHITMLLRVKNQITNIPDLR